MKNSETYIVTAKTVDEAMAIAQREYGGAGKDISFDILEMPKKGFLGLGAKDAKIKVTVTEEETISLSSIVDEMRSYRIQTDRDGGDREERQPKKQSQENKPQQQKQQSQKTDKPAQQQKQSQGEQKPKPQAQPQQKPQAQKADKPQPKQEKPAAQQSQPKPQQPKQDRAPKADKPADKPAQQPKPTEAKPVQPKPVQEKPAPQPVEKPVEVKPEPKPQPVQKPAAKAPAAKPTKVEATADGILDNMPAYTIDENREKTPVYKETGANVKTYTKSAMHTAAVADGSLGTDSAPVADVRWDSARDLKKAEEATAAAIAAAAPKTVAPISAEEAAKAADDRRSAAKDNSSARDNSSAAARDNSSPAARDKRAAAQERYAAIRGRNPQTALAAKEEDEDGIDVASTLDTASVLDSMFAEEEAYIPSDGSIDVAALDAAIEAMVEELPAPEARKKVAITQAEMDHALAFVTTLLANMQIDAEARALPCPEGEEIETAEGADVYPAMEIVGEGTGILIGHHGETLDAIQYLLNLAAIRHSDNPTGDYVKISLDIENYRAKREETLRSLARRMAARALKYKRNVFLEPMNAYERRIIHSELQMVEGVSTHSVGTDKNRKIIITYEGADRVLDDRRPRSESGSRNNNRRDNNRNRSRRDNAEAAEPQTAESGEGEGAQQNPQGNAQGEGKSRSRNRNRNRNRRSRQLDLEGPAEIQTAAGDGASAIIPPEEREALDRQLTDPGNRPAKEQKKPEVNEAEIPAFLQRPADEPAEHLREN